MSRRVSLAVVVAILQIGFLSWVIAGRAAILRDGREVLLRVQPVDPRDLLRGDYVALSYDISMLPAGLVVDRPADGGIIEAQDVLVRLTKGPEGHWMAVEAFLDDPPEPAGAEEVDIAGRLAPGWGWTDDATIPVTYGIERFYLPEGEGLAIETDLRERPFTMAVAVVEDGTAQIKAFMDGQTRLYEEPLY